MRKFATLVDLKNAANNDCLLAKFGFDKAENEPIKVSKTEKENTLET